jgi:hypothetical protein
VIASEGRGSYGQNWQYLSNGSSYSAFIIGGGYSFFGSLPGRVLKYADLNYVWDNSDLSSSIANARANGWLLHNASGQELHYQNSTGEMLVNPANSGFLSDLRGRALTFLAAHPFVDGIFIDNFLEDIRGGVGMGISFPVYTQSGQLLWSSPADFQASQLAALQNFGNAMRNAGYLVVVSGRGGTYGGANNGGAETSAWMDRYAPYVSGALVEYWLQRSDTHAVSLSTHATWNDYWNEWQTVMAHAQSLGIQFWPGDYTSTSELRQCRYLRGSFLLTWNGVGQQMLYPWTMSSDIWSTCTAFNPGLPSGAKQQVLTGVWRRDFASGYVIVNTTAAAVTVGGVSIASGDAILHQN